MNNTVRVSVRALLVAGTAAVALGVGPGFAQSAPAGAGPAASNAGGVAELGEVVVTARRREESAQRVPIAVSVVGAAQLEASGARNLEQVARQVPSLQVYSTNPRNTTLNIRGVGNNIGQSNIGLEQGVGFYLDQVYYSRPGQAMFDLVDVDRIEVLRGPQGTLFGKNTTGGALNVTSQLPTFTPELTGQVSLGDYDYHQVRGVASGPLIEGKLAGRLSFSVGHRDGNVDNVRTGEKYNGYGSEFVRGQLLFTPNEDVSLRLIGDYGHLRTQQNVLVFGGVVTTRADGSPLPRNFYVRSAQVGYTPLAPLPFDRKTDVDAPVSQKMKGGGGSAQLDWDFGSHTVTSVSSYRVWDFYPQSDIDQTAVSVLARAGQIEHHKQATQELRLASNGDQAIDYVVGAYYFWQKTNVDNTVVNGTQATQWLLGPAAPPVLNGVTTRFVANPETNSFSVFGQATWHATDQLNITAGLRQTSERKKASFNQIVGAPLAYTAKTDENNLSGRLDAAYQITPDIMTYAAYSKGYKSGGINITALPPGVPIVLEPETVDAYELGLKSSFFGRRLILNAAAFWQDVKDYQASEIVPGTTTVYLNNVPKVRSRGFEVDAEARPVSGLTLSGSVSYTDAELSDYKNGTCGIEWTGLRTSCDLSGRPIPGVSLWAGSAFAEYKAPLTLGGFSTEAYVNADYSYRSSFYSQPTISNYSKIPGYGLVGLRLGVRAESGKWDVAVWARNLFDKDYYLLSLPNAAGNSGAVFYYPGDPRTVGVTLQAKY